MDYKEKYEQAIKRAKALIKVANNQEETYNSVITIFPELKESDDERIRKALVEMVHDTTGDSLWIDYNVHKEEAIAWLEKQGEKQEVEGNPNARKPTLRIIKGKSYLCIKDYRDKNCTFTKGKIYKSDKDGFLVDDKEKDTFERKIWEEDAIEYFFLFEQSKTKNVVTDEKQKSADKVMPKFHEGDSI